MQSDYSRNEYEKISNIEEFVKNDKSLVFRRC